MQKSVFIATLILATTSLALAQNEGVLYSFQGGSDGRDPMAGVIADSAGNLYGTTYYGGSSNCSFGCGTVFELSPPSGPGSAWTETVLYAFQGGNDGNNPQAGLLFDSAGNLYGTTFSGGTASDGVVFELSPPSGKGPWTETLLHTFQGNDGAIPLAGLIFDQMGNLYGTTSHGGLGACNGGCGTAFELSPPSAPAGSWTETVLHSFGGKAEGINPLGSLVLDSQGNLYGTTEVGSGTAQYGTVFQLAPPAPGGSWTETVLYAFKDGDDGAHPIAGVILDQSGNLYGNTLNGGPFHSGGACHDTCGVVFELSPSAPGSPWTETVILTFRPAYGGYPAASLVFDAVGNLFGTTTAAGDGDGTAFQLTPSGGGWVPTILHAFQGGIDGATPYAPLFLGADGAFYGTTESGGSKNDGTIFSLNVTPIAQLSPPNLNFGNQTVNFTSTAQTVTLTNSGNSSLTITQIELTGDNSSDFAQVNNCTKPLPPAKTCKFQVTFTPSDTGARNASILITDNAQNGQQSVPLTGNGVLPAVTFSPTSLTFPAQLVFTKSAAQKVTLTNSGLGILAISNINLTGGSFRQTNNCGPNNIAPGATCTFSVTFLPTLKGPATGSVSLTDNAPASPQSFTLAGTGTVIAVNPTSLNFGTQPVGTASLPMTVTLSNKGHQPVAIEKIGILGGAAADFAQTNTCGASLASGASCLIYVTFTPTEKGYRKAILGIKDTGGGGAQEVSLEGYGT